MYEQEEKDPVERAADSILRLQLIEVNRSLLEDAIRRAVNESYGLTGGLLIDILKKRSEAYVTICSALNEINPSWWKAPTSVGEDAANFIRELAQQALEPKADTSLKQQAEAWASVVKTLDEVAPGWFILNHLTGEEAAIAAIRKLARKAAKKKAKKAASMQHHCHIVDVGHGGF